LEDEIYAVESDLSFDEVQESTRKIHREIKDNDFDYCPDDVIEALEDRGIADRVDEFEVMEIKDYEDEN